MRNLNQKGSILIIVTLGFALLGVFVGFAVDLGSAYLTRSRISRLVDGASLAAAKVLKGQPEFRNDATRAACDSMLMNGARVEMRGEGVCASTSDENFTVAVDFVNVPVPGGPAITFVQVTGMETVATNFMGLLSLIVPGDYSTIDVSATAQAGPERPVDLMLVLDRSSSMDDPDGAGRKKLDTLKCTLTGKGCSGNGFLGENFSSHDRVGMTSFGRRGCGFPNGEEFTGNICRANMPLGSDLTEIINAINKLEVSGTTNTMEGLRTAKAEIGAAFNDPARVNTRKVVLLVTDGQPTALRRDSILECETDPRLGTPLGGPSWTDGNGCYFIKRNNSTNPSESDGLSRYRLSNNKCEEHFVNPLPANPKKSETDCGLTLSPKGGSINPSLLYEHQMEAVRDTARDEAHKIRELGGRNVVIFAIGIGEPNNPDATARLDANARCLLAQIANDKDLIDVCAEAGPTEDGDQHSDLKRSTPDGTSPDFNPSQQRGKVYTVDLNGDVQAQLQAIFNEIAALLKLRLTI